MALASGTKLGPYEIVSALGAGGMGEVYRAHDTRLGRDVAIKVLPQHLSDDPDLKARFEREARTISSLNHPHICTLHDVGHQNGTEFLVLELLEGETLVARLQKGALPLKQALEIGIHIADALDKAHKNGVVHRDLKPGNVMLTKSGAKLMDFGLAKPPGSPLGLVTAASSDSPTMPALSKPLTAEGMIVGTYQYMAPEQLEGKEADARSDIFALGAVLYEMLTGKRAFAGKSAVSILSAILERDPEPISATQPLTPPVLEHVIRRALEKDPERRWQSAADLASELRWISESGSTVAMPPVVAPHRRDLSSVALWVAVVVVAAAMGFAIAFFFRQQPMPRIVRSAIFPPQKTTLVLAGDNAGPPVLSPDGAYVAFTATSAEGGVALWVRPMDSPDARRLAGTEGATFPFWSADSHFLGFFADGKLKTIDAVNGGAPFVVCEALFGRGGAWSQNGTIVFAPDAQTGLMRVDASGGTPQALTMPDPVRHSSHRWPFFLPDGEHFIYLAANHDASKSQNDAIYYASLDGKENRELFRSTSNAVYADGYLLFARGPQLMAQRFDTSGKLSGAAQPIANDVANDPSTWHMDASAAGPLLVLGNGGAADQKLIYVDRAGKELGVIADGLPNLLAMALSPKGDRLALEIDTGASEIWIQDLVRGVRTRLTFGPAWDENPVWSPDGKWITYDSLRDNKINIYRRPADGSGAEELLLSDGKANSPVAWSPDSKFLLYRVTNNRLGATALNLGGDSDLWALPMTGERKPFFVVKTGSLPIGSDHSFSPNGHWLAFTAEESGTNQVFVIPFGSGQGRWQVSQTDGFSPRWRSDGKELYFASESSNNVIGVPVEEKSGTLQFGAPQPLFPHSFSQVPLYAPLPDGKKFIMNTTSQQIGQVMSLVSNWTNTLRP
jgi:Tol biopolymer transport system component